MGGIVSSAVQPTGGMSPGGLGGAIQGAVQPAFQGGEGLGGLKAGVAPNTSNITPMPTMTNDLVQPAGAPVPMPVMRENQSAAQAAQSSPIAQQMARRAGFVSPYNTGLQMLFNRFAGPMPMYQNPALNYRPNMQQVQQNLSRVKPSVYKTDLDAARARIAELEGQLQPQNNDNYWMYNQG